MKTNLHPTCNGCGRIDPEIESNEMGYCPECLADSEARTLASFAAYRKAYRPIHDAQAEAEAIAKGPSPETIAAFTESHA